MGHILYPIIVSSVAADLFSLKAACSNYQGAKVKNREKCHAVTACCHLQWAWKAWKPPTTGNRSCSTLHCLEALCGTRIEQERSETCLTSLSGAHCAGDLAPLAQAAAGLVRLGQIPFLHVSPGHGAM